MYAIISDGAHQYRVEEGQLVAVQRKELAEGATQVEFDRVLMVGDCDGGPRIGQPVVAGAKVTAAVVGEFKDDKIDIRKHRHRKGYNLRKGHRQKLLQVRIEKILV